MRTLLILVCVLGISLTASADRGKTRAQLVQACKPDMEKHCKGLTLGEGLLKCMDQHESELVPACKAARNEARDNFKEKREEVRTACKGDFETHCKGVFGPKNKFDCLQKHSDQLSPACKAALPNRN